MLKKVKKMAAPAAVTALILALAAGCGGGSKKQVQVYTDGTYTAVSEADSRGYAQVTLTVSGDKITAAEIVEFDGMGVAKDYATYGGEMYTLLEESHTALAERIVAKNTWDVDVYTGATGTSNKVRSAAKHALMKAQVEPATANKYFNGTFMAISDKTERGWGIAWVTVENDVIVAVELKEAALKREDGQPVLDAAGNPVFELKADDYPWQEYHEARAYISDAVLKAQTAAGIDTYTGATGSSNMWLQAIQRALDLAKYR